jgi:hypothetical protein
MLGHIDPSLYKIRDGVSLEVDLLLGRVEEYSGRPYLPRYALKGTVQRDLKGVKVVLIDRSPCKLPTLRSGF